MFPVPETRNQTLLPCVPQLEATAGTSFVAQLLFITPLSYGNAPITIASTQSSLTGFGFTVTDVVALSVQPNGSNVVKV